MAFHEMGDSTFLIGDVSSIGSAGPASASASTLYRDIMGHETVRAMAVASNLEAQPDCVNCTYQPYCGVCPVHSHRTQGSIFGRMRESTLCAGPQGHPGLPFREDRKPEDPDTFETLKRWTTVRDRVTLPFQTCAT